eukprot:4906930-Pyramimonas_sp.AAC.1
MASVPGGYGGTASHPPQGATVAHSLADAARLLADDGARTQQQAKKRWNEAEKYRRESDNCKPPPATPAA